MASTKAYLGSDAFALAPFTNRVAYLEDGDVVVVEGNQVSIYDAKGRPANREIKITNATAAMVDKGGKRHFMAKEIAEQPEVIGHTLAHYIDPSGPKVELDDAKLEQVLAKAARLTISACGTAYYAGLVGKYWFEKLARLPVEVDVASELRYRDPVYAKDGAALFISQSGETADTLAALRHAKANGQTTLALVNVAGKLHRARGRHRAADLCRARKSASPRPRPSPASSRRWPRSPSRRAARAAQSTRRKKKDYAPRCSKRRATSWRCSSRNRNSRSWAKKSPRRATCSISAAARAFPIALEGALKLKEISYIHAEGYAAGEMKHGPIALIDEDVPIIVMAPHDALFEKTVSNMQEVMARGGKVLLISDAAGLVHAGAEAWAKIEVPDADSFIAPILYAIPAQLLAYYAAIAKGTDVDQPRNLAKSVTVE